MSNENWIAIGIAAVNTITTVIGFALTWKIASRQIQAALLQAKPAEKTKAEPLPRWWLRLKSLLMFITVCSSGFGLVYHFLYVPLASRLYVVAAIANSMFLLNALHELSKYVRINVRLPDA